MSQFVLVIDQGTTSTRAMIINAQGQPIAQHQQELTQYYPVEGWVEQDAEEIWQHVVDCCRQALTKARLEPKEIAALGITNQRETTVIWDRNTGKPIHKAIVWQDRRTAAMCQELRSVAANEINAKTGLLLDPYLSATKIKWLLENVAGAKAQADKGKLAFGTIDCFLLWRLTDGKVHATDATNASRTLLFNIYTQTWDKELLEFFAIPSSLLPEVHDCCYPFGTTSKNLFTAEIPITALIGDQQAALVGQACFKPGMVKITFGTGCFMLVNTGDQVLHSKNNLLSTVAYRLDGKVTYGLEGSIFNAGTVVKWLRDNLGVIHESKEIETLARQVDNTEGVHFIPAFTGLGAPFWDPLARGAILGLTRDTRLPHIARAALEAICYRVKDLLTAMQQDGVKTFEIFRVDGGMSVNNWLLQFLADMLGHEVQRPKQIESTALGAGFLAGIGCGLYPSLLSISTLWKLDQKFLPNLDSKEANRLYHAWNQAVKRVLHTAT